MWRLADSTVDTNSPYSYLMLGEYFGGTCAVAEHQSRVVGFATGLNPADEPETLFIWQIAVDPSARGLGVASGLLDHLVSRPQVPRLRYVEATVTPSNEGSTSLFRSFARRWNTECVEEELFTADDFPEALDHEPEVRFRIGAF